MSSDIHLYPSSGITCICLVLAQTPPQALSLTSGLGALAVSRNAGFAFFSSLIHSLTSRWLRRRLRGPRGSDFPSCSGRADVKVGLLGVDVDKLLPGQTLGDYVT